MEDLVELCPENCLVCEQQLSAEEIENGVGVCCKCYWIVMEEYDEEMKKHPYGI